jgi:hypothetical protein
LRNSTIASNPIKALATTPAPAIIPNFFPIDKV